MTGTFLTTDKMAPRKARKGFDESSIEISQDKDDRHAPQAGTRSNNCGRKEKATPSFSSPGTMQPEHIALKQML